MGTDLQPGGSRLVAFSRRHAVLTVWTLGLLLYAVDFLVKRLPVWREPFNVWVPIDDAFPLVPAWAWVYIFVWLGLMLGLAGWYAWENRHDWTKVRSLIIAVVVMQVSGWIVLFALPTYFPRPDLPPDLVEASLIWRIYETDPPTHKLPSLHMASIVVTAWFFCRDGRSWRYLLGAGAVVVISLSVLYTKQHGMLDVVVGVAWGWAACHVGVYGSRTRRRRRAWSLSRHHGAPGRIARPGVAPEHPGAGTASRVERQS